MAVQLRALQDICRLSGTPPTILAQIPKNPTTFLDHLRIEPLLRVYISCPNCKSIYLQQPNDNDNSPPIYCTFRPTSDVQLCGERLWKEVGISRQPSSPSPRVKFYFQDLKAWLGFMLSRKGIEDSLVMDPDALCSNPLDNAFNYPLYRDLKDHQGQAFLPGPPGELRLIFSFSQDSFNPLQMKTAKQNVSSTGLWLVLMNLPLHLRHLRQNMYLVGVIPGPGKPSKEKINPYVQLIVDDFSDAWNPGIFVSRTHNCPQGRKCKSMVVPLVCDMLAARQTIGHPSSPKAHDFCTACDLDQDDIDCIDPTKWPAMDLEHICHYATLWRDSDNNKERESIFERCGWKWSPLFELPYWNPIKFTMVDPMHAFDLNLFSNHVRELFQIDLSSLGGDRSNTKALQPRSKRAPAKEAKTVKRAVALIHENGPDLLESLLSFSRKILYTVCEDFHIRERDDILGTRWILANMIWDWRQHNVPLEPPPDVEARSSVASDSEVSDSDVEDVGSSSLPAKLIRAARVMLDPNSSEPAMENAYKDVTKKALLQLCRRISLDDQTFATKSKHKAFQAIVRDDIHISAQASLRDLLDETESGEAVVANCSDVTQSSIEEEAEGEEDVEDDRVDPKIILLGKHLLDRNADESSQRKVYDSTTKKHMIAICGAVSIDTKEISTAQKRDVFQFLRNMVRISSC
ncbi:hypothetical protein D9611_013390 [Ephemerocybe angulata]|uniref:Uncharacterized protein n=1 Tax=Ephemerocybe angulata TaxID=980116 RepID=A0A8H5BWX8_9AGAR|nr:hypothetical protein D9611_013390 [Tulosesus angulatus]